MRDRPVHKLIVFLPAHRHVAGSKARTALSTSTLVHYVTESTAGGTLQTGQTPIALLPKANDVELAFDTADVFMTTLQAPKLADSKLRQALPNLLEDRLLTDIQDCHFAFMPAGARAGTTTVGGAPRIPVAVIDRGLLTRALDIMAEAGYRVRSAFSAMYTVPAPAAGTLSVRVHGESNVVRTSAHEGFSFEFDRTGVPAALLLTIKQLGIKKILAYGSDANHLARLEAPLGASVEIQRQPMDIAATTNAVNLLQGPFATGGLLANLALPKVSRQALKLPAIYAALGAAVYLVGLNAYWMKLSSENDSVRARMASAYRSAFTQGASLPDTSDFVLLAKRNIGALRARAGIASPDDFSVLNAQAAQLLTMAPVGSVSGLEYRDGILHVKFKTDMASDPVLHNTLRAQAIQQGLTLTFEPNGSARIEPAGG